MFDDEILDGQMSLFDCEKVKMKRKPIRLIELFAGIGAQASALKRVFDNCELYKISEWEVNAVASYKAIHIDDNTDYSKDLTNEQIDDALTRFGISTDGKNPMTEEQIRRKPDKWKREVYNNFKATDNIGSVVSAKGEDLEITETDKYTYLLTYSFPCQDLSVAGKGRGMAKGSGTRSGMLWEVERLLTETNELPQILLMENVPQVHGDKHILDFEKWLDFLENLGYKNFWKDLNSKDYGVAQNRNRTFMVSFLENVNFKFPKPFPLDKTMKDYLEDEVDEKFYINNEKSKKYIEKLIICGDLPEYKKGADLNINEPKTVNTCSCICARYDSGIGNRSLEKTGVVEKVKIKQATEKGYVECEVGGVADLSFPKSQTRRGRVQGGGNVSPTITAEKTDICRIEKAKVIGGIGEKKSNGGTQYFQQDRVYSSDGLAMSHPSQLPNGSYNYLINYRIRKLTPLECWRLMGFTDEEFHKAEKVNANTQLYKQAGNSIVVDVLENIFKQIDEVMEVKE